MKDQTAFSTRFARHKDELEWLFMELYHNREGLEVLEREMAEAYNARSAELKALDKARSADPELSRSWLHCASAALQKAMYLTSFGHRTAR